MIRSILCLAAIAMFGFQAQAYYSVMDTGEIMAPGRYKLTPELQFLTKDGGADLGTDFDMGLTDDSGVRGQVGFGDTSFYLAGFYKYMPFPDTDNQPAIGFNAGLVYDASDANYPDFTVRFEPLISKHFRPDFGVITPYASLPLGLQHRGNAQKYANDQNNLAIQLALGTQVDLKSLPNVGLMFELGFDINKAPSYVSLGAAWSFGAEEGNRPAKAQEE